MGVGIVALLATVEVGTTEEGIVNGDGEDNISWEVFEEKDEIREDIWVCRLDWKVSSWAHVDE